MSFVDCRRSSEEDWTAPPSSAGPACTQIAMQTQTTGADLSSTSEGLKETPVDAAAQCGALSASEDDTPELSRGNLMPNWITSLEDELNQRLLVVLRDGRTLVGFLRTFDQFGNLVLEHCVQRLVAGRAYADIHVGLMVIRGENVLLFGAFDDKRPNALQQQPLWSVLQQRDIQEKEEALRIKRLREVGDFGYGLELYEE